MWRVSWSPQLILAGLEGHYLVAGLFPVEKLPLVAALVLHHLDEIAGRGFFIKFWHSLFVLDISGFYLLISCTSPLCLFYSIPWVLYFAEFVLDARPYFFCLFLRLKAKILNDRHDQVLAMYALA